VNCGDEIDRPPICCTITFICWSAAGQTCVIVAVAPL
jgi:hypothetical protein